MANDYYSNQVNALNHLLLVVESCWIFFLFLFEIAELEALNVDENARASPVLERAIVYLIEGLENWGQEPS